MHKKIKINADIVLNKKEQTFLKLACTQLTYREIAKKMKRSPRTIDGYRDELFTRFKLINRTGLVLFALKHRIVKLKEIKL